MKPHPVSPERDIDRAAHASADFVADVQYYLTQDPRQLPSRYLYDDLGSSLFEAICELPWYRITRAERRLLAQQSSELFGRFGSPDTIVELGPGSGEKLRILLDQRPPSPADTDVHLVDVSSRALELSSRLLASVDRVRVFTHRARYEAGVEEISRRRDRRSRMLVLFLGSNIGNFDPPGAHALLGGVRSQMRGGDALLLGADLVKPEAELLAAYDDPLGVTSAFNRNLLVRINRELGGDFDLRRFSHRAVWNGGESRVEMHLVSDRRQRVRVQAANLGFTMRKGETIWTESSYKYSPEEIGRFLAAAGFRVDAQWVDEAAKFALTLAIA